MSESPERRAFKDWFDRDAACRLAEQVGSVAADFDKDTFVQTATADLSQLEFSGRVQQFAYALRECLPEPVPRALELLTASLPAPLPDCDSVTDGWIQWPIGQFIAEHGLEHFEASMQAMIELTQRFSSEFAVRPFVERFPKKTINRLRELTNHPSPHVRRWCSEGTRPRLPWGRKLKALAAAPDPIFPILDALLDDSELYVRRSVANNLNDIAKDHPDRVIKWCSRRNDKKHPHRGWLVKHALRTLIKDGHPGALAEIGFGPPQRLEAELRARPQRVVVGNSVELTARLGSRAGRSQDLIIDYAIHYVRQGGKTSTKVFKWTTLNLPANGKLDLSKRHPMRETTVRALYAGIHKVELQVNGRRVAESQFRLVDPEQPAASKPEA